MHRLLRRLGAGALFAALASTTSATTMIAQSVEMLSLRSDAIVRATALSSHADWDATHRLIVTTTRMRAIESLRGAMSPGAEFEVRTMGGTVDGTQLTILGAPRFRGGEECVVFLRALGGGSYGVTDLSQGKFEIVRDAAGRARLTRAGLAGVDLVGPGATGQAMDLDRLRERIAHTPNVTLPR